MKCHPLLVAGFFYQELVHYYYNTPLLYNKIRTHEECKVHVNSMLKISGKYVSYPKMYQ